MACKARQTLQEASELLGRELFCGAASRAYYAIYQALSWKFSRYAASKNLKPEAMDAHYKHGKDGYSWSHDFVRKNCDGVAKVGQDNKDVMEQAWLLRVKADYLDDPVEDDEAREIVDACPSILEEIGIPT